MPLDQVSKSAAPSFMATCGSGCGSLYHRAVSVTANLENVDVGGQLAIGDNNLQLTVNGGVVHVAQSHARKDARRESVTLRPRPPAKFVGREKELAAITAKDAASALLVCGPLGVGKTTLLRKVAHLEPKLRAEVAYLSARNQAYLDVAQSLYDAFYERQSARSTDAEIRHGLSGVEALVLIDDATLTPDETTTLLDLAPQARFIVAAESSDVLPDKIPLAHLAELEAPQAVGGSPRPIDRDVTLLLAAAGGGPVRADDVEAVLGSGAEEAIERLAGQRVVSEVDGRVTLLTSADALRSDPAARPLAQRLVERLLHRDEHPDLRRASGVTAPLLSLIGIADARAALSAARKIEPRLVESGAWGEWGRVLGMSADWARALGDRASEAWAEHEIGTRALCMKNHAAARPALERALRIREELGLADATAVTRANLALLGAPPFPIAKVALLGGGGALVAAAIVAGVIYLPPPPQPLPPDAGVRPPVEASALAPIEVDDDDIDFGNVRVGAVIKARTLTARTADEADVDALIEGESPFAVAKQRRADCNPCTFSVSVAARAAGDMTGTITLRAGERRTTVKLHASGREAKLMAEPDPLTFELPPAREKLVKRLTLRNRGQIGITLGRPQFAGHDPRRFSLETSTCNSLAPDGTCTMDIGVLPGDRGVFAASLRIVDAQNVTVDDVALEARVVRTVDCGTSTNLKIDFGPWPSDVTLVSVVVSNENVQRVDGGLRSGEPQRIFSAHAPTCGDFGGGARIPAGKTCSIGVDIDRSRPGTYSGAASVRVKPDGLSDRVMLTCKVGVRIP
jgi:hypothetical protein